MDELMHQLDQSVSVRHGQKMQAELERMRADLYAMVSHDLRTPINAIQLAAGALVEDFGEDEMSAEVRHLAGTILKNTESLVRQLNDFLDFSKLDAGMFRLELDQSDLVRLARDAAQQLEPLAKKRGHTLTMSASPEASAGAGCQLGSPTVSCTTPDQVLTSSPCGSTACRIFPIANPRRQAKLSI